MKLPAVLVSVMLLALAACQPPAATPADAPPAPQAPALAAPPDPPAAPAVATAAPSPPPQSFQCRGNEPFWALDIHADRAVLKTPESETELVGELRAAGTGAFTFRGAPDGSPDQVIGALMAPAQCFDSMADGPAQPFSAQVSFADGQVADGCCSVE